jgi:hypothetical protein
MKGQQVADMGFLRCQAFRRSGSVKDEYEHE